MPDEEGRAPTAITLHQKSRLLEILFSDGRIFKLPYEFLRVHSPSAEVRGHGPGQEVLQVGKSKVQIRSLEPAFSDSHATGIYSWDYLRHLDENQDRLWAEYLEKLAKAGASRD